MRTPDTGSQSASDFRCRKTKSHRIEGEGDFSGGKLCVTVRVESKPVRAVYVREAGANHEYPLEYFATIARTMTRLPNDEVCDGGRKTSELKPSANRHSQD